MFAWLYQDPPCRLTRCILHISRYRVVRSKAQILLLSCCKTNNQLWQLTLLEHLILSPNDNALHPMAHILSCFIAFPVALLFLSRCFSCRVAFPVALPFLLHCLSCRIASPGALQSNNGLWWLIALYPAQATILPSLIALILRHPLQSHSTIMTPFTKCTSS
jgi:hypothetical protein